MLILTRKPGQIIKIAHAANLDPYTPIGEVFVNGPMEVMVSSVHGRQVRIGIRAHPGLLILRAELYARSIERALRRKLRV